MGNGLGKLTAVHGVAPTYMQRAAFIAVLSFLFFLAMIFAFYLRGNILYFLLSTAFLIAYLITMFALVRQRRSMVEVFENGVLYRAKSAAWVDIIDVREDGNIELVDGSTMTIPSSMTDFPKLIATLRRRAGVNGPS